jgi:hypothetical protein
MRAPRHKKKEILKIKIKIRGSWSVGLAFSLRCRLSSTKKKNQKTLYGKKKENLYRRRMATLSLLFAA